ncbi:MAG: hypothetical protein ACLFPJ_05150 [Candidatus Woesearchaeota archaeon]
MIKNFKTLVALFVLSLFILSGCTIFTDNKNDEICIPKDKLDEVNLTIDELIEKALKELQEINETIIENETIVNETIIDDEEPTNETLVGDDVDEHGCIPSAGYVWCESLGECIRPWETDCPETIIDDEDKEELEDTIETKTFTAGELINVKPVVTEGAKDVVFTFSYPLDDNGEWQTTDDDVGEYIVNITATNAVGSVTKQLKLVVLKGNMPPVISNLESQTIHAGEIITLNFDVTDPDGDDVIVTYSGFMNESTKTTTNNDVGVHNVTVTASDGELETSQTIQITVLEPRNPPVIEDISSIQVTEGEKVVADVEAYSDDDDRDVALTFSAPLDNNGEWQTQIGDAGTYSITVTASDGELETTKTFSVVVENVNRAPVITHPDELEFTVIKGETKTITLNPEVTDPDGDEVTVTYSGFMTTNTTTIDENDEGSHTVTITASDELTQVSSDVTIIIEVDAPPEFVFE